MTERLQLGIIFGGASVEHVISLRSARNIYDAVDRERFEPRLFGITREGRWLTPEVSQAAFRSAMQHSEMPISCPAPAGRSPIPLETLDALARCDAVFPAVHGANGEDGTLQGLLELMGLPYVGPGTTASALAMDKAAAKAVFAAAGVPVAPAAVLSRADWIADRAGTIRAAAEIAPPAFVKPANGGSSIGVARVADREQLDGALEAAFRLDRTALVETAMPEAREIECAVLGNDELRVSAPGEIVSRREFYDYEAKYSDPATELIIPAQLDEATAARVRELSAAACRAVGTRGMSRADFLLGPGGRLWLGELNTIPGFTGSSMYPLLWAHEGLELPELITELVLLALEDAGRGAGAATC